MGIPLNPKTCFIVPIIRVLLHMEMPHYDIRESMDLTVPIHPFANKDTPAQYLPKDCSAALLLTYTTPYPLRDEGPPSPSGSSASSSPTSSSTGNSSEQEGWDVENQSLGTERIQKQSSLVSRSGHSEIVGNDSDDDEAPVAASEESSTDYPASDASSSKKEANAALEYHLLSSPSDILRPSFGLLCLSDVDSVYMCMASALHQRRIWGIKSPIVGLAFDPMCTTVQVVFGWWEANDEEREGDIPIPRIAHTFSNDPAGEQAGVFDISDPTSAARLSTFLNRLEPEFLQTQADVDAASIRILTQVEFGMPPFWRSDGHVYECLGEVGREETAAAAMQIFIDDWRNKVTGMMDCSTKSPKESDPKLPQTGSRTPRSAKSKPPSLASISEDHKSQYEYKMQRRSASELARGSNAPEGDANEYTAMWIHDRNVLIHSLPCATNLSRIMNPGVAALYGDFMRPIASVYEKMTCLYFPKEWIQVETRPPVRKENESLLTQLVVEINARNSDTETRFQSETRVAPDWIRMILEDNLDCILDAVRNTLAHVAASKHSTVLELEWSHSWDRLCMEFCSKYNVGQAHPVVFSMERTLSLPKNEYAYDSKTNAASLRKIKTNLDKRFLRYLAILLNDRELAEEALEEAEDSYDDVAAAQYNSALAAYTTAYTVHRKWISELHLSAGQERVDRDPKTAKCDGLASLQIQGFFPDLVGKKENRFAFSHRTKKKITQPERWSKIDVAVQRTVNAKQYRDVMSGAVLSFLSSPESLPPTSESLADGLQGMNLDDDAEDYWQETGGHLDIPFLTIVNKKRNEKVEETAANQNRLYTTSMVKFLQMLGITDFPVFGVIAEGPVGVVSCAWGENIDEEVTTRLADRLLRGFDISTPLGALNYATFLLMISYEHGERLRSKFADETIQQKVRAWLANDATAANWNMEQMQAKV
ncbi:hypothetical protein QCA50_000050 [Cerrena zonata]|uniref:Uncharacterized protein n=1 Tax=Cerrena zonata TaxID=2478898 RepID=A0AAW0GTW6_9APHY